MYTGNISCLIGIAEVDLGRRSTGGRCHLKICKEPEDIILCPLDITWLPALWCTNFKGDCWNGVVNPRGLDRTRFARIDFDDIRLGKLCETLDIGKSEVGIAPKRAAIAGCGCICKILRSCSVRRARNWQSNSAA
jgi:hypothetical protein